MEQKEAVRTRSDRNGIAPGGQARRERPVVRTEERELLHGPGPTTSLSLCNALRRTHRHAQDGGPTEHPQPLSRLLQLHPEHFCPPTDDFQCFQHVPTIRLRVIVSLARSCFPLPPISANCIPLNGDVHTVSNTGNLCKLLPALFMTASAAIAPSLLRQTWPHSSGGQVGGLAARSLNVLFQVRLGFSQLRAPVSRRDRAISRRTCHE